MGATPSAAKRSLPKERQPVGARDLRGLPKVLVNAIIQGNAKRSRNDRRTHHGKTTQLGHVVRLRHRDPHWVRWGAIGLHLTFYTDDEGWCIARFQPKPEQQGYSGQLHGAVISTLPRLL
jgi:hypothetical protein